MYLRLTEGTDEQLDLSVSPVFRAWAGFFALLVLLVGPLALPALAEARGHKHHRHHHSKHHSLALARKSDSGGGDEHAGAISHAEDHQGVNPSNNTHNAQPGTQNSANKVGTANTNNSHNAQPGTQNSD
jgi:hypothetical protein